MGSHADAGIGTAIANAITAKTVVARNIEPDVPGVDSPLCREHAASTVDGHAEKSAAMSAPPRFDLAQVASIRIDG